MRITSKKCIIQEVTVDFSGMDVLNSQDYIKCKRFGRRN